MDLEGELKKRVKPLGSGEMQLEEREDLLLK
jgi:hypothetical protein